MAARTDAIVLVVMGVSGSGKSTIAELLAEKLGWPFQEGDALHPAANVAKMAAGHPLSDEDRWPWLEIVADWADARLDSGESGIVTCSALKRSYRDAINRRGTGVEFVYLAGTGSRIRAQLEQRKGHFMPPSLLGSQLETLEEPTEDEPALTVALGRPPGVIADEVIDRLGLVPR